MPSRRSSKTNPILVFGVPALLVLLLGGACVLYMPGSSHRGPLPALTAHEKLIARNLRVHVEKLAGEIGERNVFNYPGLVASAEYIEERFRALGYRVRRQEYVARDKKVWNIIAVPPASGPSANNKREESKRPVVLIGAHYDSVYGSPGADDNASGVAATLEIARMLAPAILRRPPGAKGNAPMFVAFVNEEPPFFQTESMGSLVLARSMKKRGVRMRAMLSLETMGYYSDAKGSQSYPFPFSLFFPDRGNFIGFVGDSGSSSLVRETIGGFRARARFPSEGIAVNDSIPGIGWSDHWSFSKVGYKGVMITDTAPFRNPHYHMKSDLPDVIDYERMARVTRGLTGVAAHFIGVEK